MPRFTLLVLCSLVIFSLFGCSHTGMVPVDPVLSPPQLARQITSQSVALLNPVNDKAMCSATWVSHDTILTAHHCVVGYAKVLHRFQIFKALMAAGMPKVIAFIVSGQDPGDQDDDSSDAIKQALQQANQMFPMPKLQGLVMSYSAPSETGDLGLAPSIKHHVTAYALYPDWDLALLHASADAPAHGVATIATQTPEIGESVSFIGNAHGNWFTFRRTVVVAYRQDLSHDGMEDIKGPFMELQGNVLHGDSGSAPFNDRGQMVGVNSFMDTDTMFAFCIHLDTIRGVLLGQHLLTVALQPDVKIDPKLGL